MCNRSNEHSRSLKIRKDCGKLFNDVGNKTRFNNLNSIDL